MQFPHISSFHLCMFLIFYAHFDILLFPNFFISSSLTKTQNTTNIYICVPFPDHLLDPSFPASFILWPISMEEELPSNKKRGFCKCFWPLKGELLRKSLLSTFLPPKEHHGMFFCHTLIKKQQGQASLWMAYLKQLTVARVEITANGAKAHLIIGELRGNLAIPAHQNKGWYYTHLTFNNSSSLLLLHTTTKWLQWYSL